MDTGIWVKEIRFVDESGPLTFRAHTPMDLIDVYTLRFGDLSDEVKKLGPVWNGP